MKATNCDISHPLAFFAEWLRAPLRTAAVLPSGTQLAQRMLQSLPTGRPRIIELGSGTGVFTKAMLRRGVQAEDMFAVELNPRFHRLLSTNFPTIRCALGDACALPVLAEEYLRQGLADVVMSGLGLRSMSVDTRFRIIGAAFACLKPGGCFVQFTYGRRFPLPLTRLKQLGLRARLVGRAWFNVPPANVYALERVADRP